MAEEPLDKLDPTKIAQDLSVQSRNTENSAGWTWGGMTERNPLLPPYGTKARDQALMRLHRDDMNNMAKGLFSGIIKKIQATPYEIRAPKYYGTYWQRMLASADLGSGWATFIGKLTLDFLRYDGGAFVELIGSGDPSEPLLTAPVAIANLDSLRCWITGDDEYPVWYYSADGYVYKMHYTRIAQMLDTPESDERNRGYGYCALSRAVVSVTKDILMNRYLVQLLDDNPPPGFVLFKNIGEDRLVQAITRRDAERATDSGGVWGRSVKLFGMDMAEAPSVEFITYSQPPQGFDYVNYQNQLAKEMANSVNVDVQEFWELSGGGIGTGTQSEILAQKSRGKTIGNLYKQIERLINSILPDDCEFVFEYDDPQRDNDIATNATSWVGISASLSDVLSADERRKLIANQVPAIADVITDDEGVIQNLGDSGIDTQTELEARIPDTGVSNINEENTTLADDVEKSIASTARAFADRFKRTVNSFIGNRISKYLARQAMRATLLDKGREAYQDGKEVAGDERAIDRDDEMNIMKWLNEQTSYVDKFLNEITDGKVAKSQVDNHIEMWINKSIQTAYHDGMYKSGAGKFFMWVYHPTAEHCDTCLRANGQIHRLRAWRNAGVIPQSSRLQCMGYNCKCRLVPITGARLFGKGDLRSVKRTLKEHKHTPPKLTITEQPIDYVSALDRLDQLAKGL